MKLTYTVISALLLCVTCNAYAQVTARDVNGASNSAANGTRLDTNVTFSLRMTLAGNETLIDTAESGQDVSIHTIIRPEAEDVGQPADIIIVDYRPPIPYMRNLDGNFVAWNGKLSQLVASQEGITLTDELDVEVFSGQLANTGDHRIFVGFLVGDVLYFTPSALRISITEPAPPEPSALEQAVELFNSTISSTIVQANCIECHVSGGLAAGTIHQFVRTSNADHLDINFEEFRQLHEARGTDFILSKVQGMLGHGGGVRLTASSTGFSNLSTFLDLLDQADTETASTLLNDPDSMSDSTDESENPYAY